MNARKPPAPKPAIRRLLIAEDNNEMRQLLVRTLTREGFEVVSAMHGREALELIQRGGAPFDMLISDVRMPEMDGEQLLAALAPHLPALKVILVTSYGTPEQNQRYREMGAVDFIIKPFKIPDLLEAIERAIPPAA